MTVMDRLETMEKRLAEVEHCCQKLREDVNSILFGVLQGPPRKRARKRGPVKIMESE
jgi:hypothetical protein